MKGEMLELMFVYQDIQDKLFDIDRTWQNSLVFYGLKQESGCVYESADCTESKVSPRIFSGRTGQNAAAGAGVAAIRPQHAAGDPVQPRAPGLPRPGRPVRLQTGRRVLRGKPAATQPALYRVVTAEMVGQGGGAAQEAAAEDEGNPGEVTPHSPLFKHYLSCHIRWRKISHAPPSLGDGNWRNSCAT